jgi:hypothetical protein
LSNKSPNVSYILLTLPGIAIRKETALNTARLAQKPMDTF